MSRDRFRIALALLLWAPLSLPEVFASDLRTFVPRGGVAYPGPCSYFLIDAGSALSPAEALRSGGYRPLDRNSRSFAYRPGTFWFRFRMVRPADDHRSLSLVFQSLHLDTVNVHLFAPDGTPIASASLGDTDARYRAPPRSHLPAVTLPEGREFTVLTEIRSTNSVVFTPQVMETESLAMLNARFVAALGAVLGLVLALACFHLVAYRAHRERAYFRYGIYLAAASLFFFEYFGLTTLIVPRSAGLQNRLDIPAPLFLIWAFLRFAVPFARVDSLSSGRFLDRLSRLLLVAPAAALLLGQRRLALLTLNALAAFVLLWLVPLVLRQGLRGVREARAFLAGWGLYLLGMFLHTIASLGMVPSFIAAAYLTLAGFLVEAVFVSYLLVEKIRALRRLVESQWRDLARAEHLSALGTLAGEIIHELSGPSHIIGLNAEAALAAFGDWRPALPEARADEYEAGLRDIREVSRHMSRTIESIKTYVRPAEDRPETFDAALVARSTLKLYRAALGVEPKYVSAEIPDEPLPIRGAPLKFQQLLVNLLRNAAQALEGADRRIRLSLVRRDGEVDLVVEDEGRGMDAETLRKLGTAFFTTRRDAGGTGLGVRICFGIVEEFGGSLTYRSEPGAGTTATVTLPVAAEA